MLTSLDNMNMRTGRFPHCELWASALGPATFGRLISVIISAKGRPLLAAATGSVLLHLSGSCKFHQVVGPPCMGPTRTAPSSTWSPFQNFVTLSVICSVGNVWEPRTPVNIGIPGSLVACSTYLFWPTFSYQARI